MSPQHYFHLRVTFLHQYFTIMIISTKTYIVTNKLRGFTLFTSTDNIEIRKHAIVRLTQNIYFQTTLFMASPLHILLMASSEGLK